MVTSQSRLLWFDKSRPPEPFSRVPLRPPFGSLEKSRRVPPKLFSAHRRKFLALALFPQICFHGSFLVDNDGRIIDVENSPLSLVNQVRPTGVALGRNDPEINHGDDDVDVRVYVNCNGAVTVTRSTY